MCRAGSITISGGTVTAVGAEYAAAIGGSRQGGRVTICITGGQVTATGGYVGIGNGEDGLACTTEMTWTEDVYDTMSVKADSWNGNVTLEKSFSDGSRYYEAGSIVDGQAFNGKTVVPLVIALVTPDFVIPSDVTSIEEDAFEGIAASAVEIPAGCASIGSGVFRNCLSLTQVRIPESCAIGEDAFEGCGTVCLIGATGSSTETYCQTHDNCVFVPVE